MGEKENIQNSTSQTENTKGEKRLNYIDNLRILLTFLVIAHHSAITYGAMGSWMYYEQSNLITSILLTWFTAVNQAFFMGLFFTLSGYFIPQSLNKKGIKEYKRDRLIRLGIPLLVYTFFLNYIVWWMVAVVTEGIEISLGAFIIMQLGNVNLATGPLWFVLTLLVYTYIYIYFHQINIKKKRDFNPILEKIEITSLNIEKFAILLGIITFIVRIFFPTEFKIPLIEGLGFQLGYTPQYFCCFLIGIVASQKKWFEKITIAQGKISLIISVIFGVTIFAFANGIGIFNNYNGPSLSGGFTWTSLLYSLMESFLTVNISITLLVVFRDKFNSQYKFGKFLSNNAYTVYIIHPLVVVGIALLLRPFLIYPLIKWLILTLFAIVGCFICSALIRKIPKITRILG